jgi:hypothetical protein
MIPVAARLLEQHPSLMAMQRRLRWRWLMECAQVALLWSLAGAGLLIVVGRLYALGDWRTGALVCAALGVGLSIAQRLSRWPRLRAAAVAADGLGLEERVVSSLDARRVGHPVAALLERDAARALARLRVDQYPLVRDGRAWRHIAALAAAVIALWVVPLPTIGDRGRQADEAQAVLAARRALERTSAEVTRLSSSDPVSAAAASELHELDRSLARTTSVEAAAQQLEAAQERLASLGRAEEFAWRRALDAAAQSWMNEAELQSLARALAAHDELAVQQAAVDLAERGDALGSDQLRRLSLGLQAGANAARDAPPVAGALREIAAELGAAGSDDAAAAAANVAQRLRAGAARAAGLDTAQRAVAVLGSARAALGAAGTAASGGRAASGSAGGQTGSQAGQASGSQARTNVAGQGRGQGSGAGSGSNIAQGSGTSGNAGAGSGGPPGSGAGAGAGAGGGPSPGQPGSASGGQTLAGGRAAPGSGGTAVYVPLAGPSLMGGAAGPDVAVAGDVSTATGELAELPESPLALGALRPYEAVYAEYELGARQALSRQPLPPALEALVQRYFTAISPPGLEP